MKLLYLVESGESKFLVFDEMPDKISTKYGLDHQGLKVLGTVNVIVDEVCGEGTWIKYSERSERWRKGEEERERIKLERLRKEEEARYKDFDEKLEEWKSGEINFLNTPFYIPGEKPNA